jgi:secreted trypsin-like serine protease
LLACGEANIFNHGRIVNGKQTTPHKWPWMVAMFSPKNNFMCGGSIISTKVVLTAGHCLFYSKAPLQTTWRLGVHLIKEFKSNNRYRTANYQIHPRFTNNTFYDDWDIAVAALDRNVQFTHDIKPICLPRDGSETFIGKLATVAGW